MIDTIRMILDKDTFTVVNPAYFGLYDIYSLKRLTTTKREQYTWKDIGKKKPQEETYDTDESIEDEENANAIHNFDEEGNEEQSTTDKAYKPKVFLINNFGKLELILEFSIPKLMFGNNLEEVCQADYELVILKIISTLWGMGIEVKHELNIKEARISQVHFGKNFIMTDILNPRTMINLIAKNDPHFKTDVSTKFYKNGGQLVSFYSKSQNILFYDKMSEIKQGIRVGAKRSIEKDGKLSANHLCEYGGHAILRMEVRLNGKGKIIGILKNQDNTKTLMLGISKGGKITERLIFQDVFDDELSKKVLTTYLQQIRANLKVVLHSYNENILHILLAKKVKWKDAFAYYGAFKYILDNDDRALARLSPKMSDKMREYFGSLEADEITASQDKLYINAFNYLEDVLYNFKPIRLEEGVKLEDFVKKVNQDKDFINRFQSVVELQDTQKHLEYSKLNLGRFIYLGKKEDIAFKKELEETLKRRQEKKVKDNEGLKGNTSSQKQNEDKGEILYSSYTSKSPVWDEEEETKI